MVRCWRLRYVQIFARNAEFYSTIRKFGFCATRQKRTQNFLHLEFRSQEATFLVTTRCWTSLSDGNHKNLPFSSVSDIYAGNEQDSSDLSRFNAVLESLPGNRRYSPLPSVCNPVLDTSCSGSCVGLCFEVTGVSKLVADVEKSGGTVLLHPKRFSLVGCASCKHFGKVDATVAIVVPPFFSVRHVLVETHETTNSCLCAWLPDFSQFCDSDNNALEHCELTNFDHVAFACQSGSTDTILKWYNKVFQMHRFKVNSSERSDGFIVRDDDNQIGMKLLAMEYWNCGENELELSKNSKRGEVKIVLAEALPGQGINQVETFLVENEGPGVQHIGLHTSNMIQTMSTLKARDIQFIVPPHTYYTQDIRLDDIQAIGLDCNILEKNHILLDLEGSSQDGDTSQKTQYLMQAFTRPLFERDTFFLEVIQRLGATGFGAGNITALFKAVQLYLTEGTARTNKQCSEGNAR